MSKAKIAVVGAGLAGLSVANLLGKRANVTLFEKSRGTGGRMATRYASPYYFDHGAQYFTCRTVEFESFIRPLVHQGIIRPWRARYARFEGTKRVNKDDTDSESRYVGSPAMNAIGKYLAQSLLVHMSTEVVSVESDNARWHLVDENNQRYEGFDWVVSTLPSPQAQILLPESFAYYDQLQSHPMQGCFALMLGFSVPLSLDFDAAHVTQSDISWIAVNSHKPERKSEFSLLVHSSADYADAHIEDDPQSVTQHLVNELSRVISQKLETPVHQALHRWRYASNQYRKAAEQVYVDHDRKLAACGDWCEGGRVEGAFTSAFRLVSALEKEGI